MFHYSKEKNTIIIDSNNFEENKNYLPFLVECLRNLNQKKLITINFYIKVPVAFILYILKILDSTETTKFQLNMLEGQKELEEFLEAQKYYPDRLDYSFIS